MKKRALLVGALFLCLLFPFSTSAFAYSQVVAFGDSLSDNGPEDGDGVSIGLQIRRDLFGLNTWLKTSGLNCWIWPMEEQGQITIPQPTLKCYGLSWQIDQYLSMPGSGG